MCPWFYTFIINAVMYFVFGIMDVDWFHICLIVPHIYFVIAIWSLYRKEMEDNELRLRYNIRMAKESQEVSELF